MGCTDSLEDLNTKNLKPANHYLDLKENWVLIGSIRKKSRWGSSSLIQQYASGEGNSTGGLESMMAAVPRQGNACSKSALSMMRLVEQTKDSTVLP